MDFVFTYGPGTTLEQMVAFETAGKLWASHFTDNVTVNIYVEPSSNLPTGVAGGALMGIAADQQYSTWRSSLATDSQSADDQTVQQTLPSNTSSFTAWVNEVGPDGMTSNKLQQTSNTLNLSRANAKALGMRGGQDAGLDGYILMSSQLPNQGFDWNYSLSGAPPANSIDFFSVAVHEIGHVLGFYSGVDASGWQLTPIAGFDDDDDDDDDDGGVGSNDLDPRGPLKNATSLDMMRFSNRDSIDLVVGGSPFFSVDGGTSRNADFATGVNRDLGGDGFQASHWKSSGGGLGIMEPDISLGSRRGITGLDRRGIDTIGWDLGPGSTDLVGLQTQAKQALAQRLGVTVAQLEANPALAQQLTQNRSQDVAFMVGQSEVYEWRRSRNSRATGWWHEITPPAAQVGSTGSELATGWAEATLSSTDRLTATGSQQAETTSTLASTRLASGMSSNMTGSELLTSRSTLELASTGSTLGNSKLNLTDLNALSTNYLIGSELLQTGF
jgi:hypothetical protein